MEPISAVASIITLVALAKEVSVLAADLFSDFHAAPKELKGLREHSNLISKQLLCFQRASDVLGLDQLLESSEIQVLDQALETAKFIISAIHADCGDLGRRSKRRLTWTLYEKKKADEYLKQLAKTEASLGTVLHLVNLKTSSRAYLRTTQQILDTQDAIEKLRIEQQTPPSALVQLDHVTTLGIKDTSKGWKYLTTRSASNFWKTLFNFELSVVVSTKGSHKRYDVLAVFLVPTLIGLLALRVTISLRRASCTWSNVDLLGGRISVVNHVPKDSEIITACRKGDLVAVQTLFRQGRASSNDVSERSKTLLWHATASGSIELVEYLIHQGTPVSSSILLNAAFWRRPQIARLLLDKDANPEIMGANGNTLAILLFSSYSEAKPQIEFLEILGCNSFSMFDAQDDVGWTALHRAAAFGTAEDVRTLLRFKASPQVRTYNLEWTPLFCAVCFGNLETVHELWPHYESASEAKDLRGWNLLHVAAGAGRFHVLPFLLEKGVEVHAVSRATSRFVPHAIIGLKVMPSDVARSCGEQSYSKWTEIVRGSGFGAEAMPLEVDWSSNEMHGRYGGCECCETWDF